MERQQVDLREIMLNGRILDIGGGGEGVIARHAGDSVIAIDRLKGELEESPNVGIKIIMDAANMQFLDNTFDHATCFFSLMYMSDETIEKALHEAYRVLKSDGCLWIWDVTIPPSDGEGSIVVQLAIQTANEEITTGYGTGWKAGYKGQTIDDIVCLCQKAGFDVIKSHTYGQILFLKAVKQ